MLDKNVIYRLTADGHGGVTVNEMAEACYALERVLGVPVEFRHNDRIYHATLNAHQVGGPPPPPEDNSR